MWGSVGSLLSSKLGMLRGHWRGLLLKRREWWQFKILFFDVHFHITVLPNVVIEVSIQVRSIGGLEPLLYGTHMLSTTSRGDSG
jgi:hypothetical protein